MPNPNTPPGSYYGHSPKLDPENSQSGSKRIMRGSSFDNAANYLCSGLRNLRAPGDGTYAPGFRCARAWDACDDGNACTLDAAGKSGKCTRASVKDGEVCYDGDACTAGTCKSGACESAPKLDSACCQSAGGVMEAGKYRVKTENGREWAGVPAGTFRMGCNATLDKSCGSHEKPQHQVIIGKPFWLGLTEVRVAQYKACVDAGKCSAPNMNASFCAGANKKWHNLGTEKSGRGDHPVNRIDRSRSAAYCQWAGGALPTEARWEYAARGRCQDKGSGAAQPDCKGKMRVYPWGNGGPVCGKNAVCGSDGCGQDRTRAVKAGSASGRGPFGHYDMAGNVWEWVRDGYSGGCHESSPKQDPENTNNALGGVVRGDSFHNAPVYSRASTRLNAGPSGTNVTIGLRCASPFP